MSQPTVSRGRLYIALAALLWSTSGAFTKVLTRETPIGAWPPDIETWTFAGAAYPIQIAFYRALFAGLALTVAVRPADLTFRPLMLAMGVIFALMNITFISAQALGTAANAILLQYSAPLWLYLASVFWLGDKPDRRGAVALLLGVLGIAVIIAGGWSEGELLVMGIGLASGITYASVLLCLRVLRDVSSAWLTVWNHLLGAFVLLPIVLVLKPPTWWQFVVLFFFGSVQMGLAYWLMAKGLRVVSPVEAGMITLLEPLFNPIWAYLIAGEVPHSLTFVGGALIVGALVWRYWPRKAV